MAVPSSTPEKAAGKRSTADVAEPESPLRAVRIERGLTQTELASLAGMHRNSILKLENGTTQEVTSENADALARALKTPISRLGLRVRAAAAARSIRIRRLTAEQRQIVDELLSLPPEDYALIRGAIERLRVNRRKKRTRGAR